ncbi:hypothetical protein BH11BAC7_BH11BAC7_08700 [soil metagenome]
MSIRLQLFTGFFVLILIFFINYFVNQRLSNQVLINTTYISNSETVIRNSNILHKEIIEMQSGFRGFLLTGQEVFLEPYYEGMRSVPPLIKEELSLLNSSKQKEKLDSIYMLHKEWLNYTDGLITTRLDTLPEASKRYKELFETKLRMEVGKKLNDKIHEMFYAFDNYEYMIRLERRKTLQSSLSYTKDITLGLALLSIVLALLSSLYFIITITRRISKMVNLAEDISKGSFKTLNDPKKDELNKLAVSLNVMSKTLEKNFNELTKKNKELDEFAYVVSHDLKAPLRGISNIISWIEEDHDHEISPEIKRNLILIKGRAIRLENMINGLLDYARVSKGKKDVQKFNVANLVNEIVDLLVPENYEVIVDENMPELVTEKLLMEQIFSNLISNAVKYNDKSIGRITITSREITGYYEFSVSDNGAGIQSEYFEKIFVIFQTLQERDAFESTGVGLAIIKKIIEEHKGSIWVKSKFGEGSTFTFTWPIRKEKLN